MISKKELDEWKLNPVTKKVFDELSKELDSYAAAFLRGAYILETSEKTALEVAKVSGIIQGITRIFDLEGIEDE